MKYFVINTEKKVLNAMLVGIEINNKAFYNKKTQKLLN